MKSLTIHLRILIIILVGVGLFTIFYERYALEIPFSEQEKGKLWTVDAKLTYNIPRNAPVSANFFIPSRFDKFVKHDEVLISDKEYGENFEIDELNNRIAHYSIRRASGKETLYYRLSLSKNYVQDGQLDDEGSVYRTPIPLSEPDKLAADALIKSIRKSSSNTASFISETIKIVNDPKNKRAQALLANNNSINNKVRIIESLLSQAHIPIQKVNTIQLVKSEDQVPETWIRSFIDVNKRAEDSNRMITEGKWFYFNPETAQMGLPKDRFIWWVGNEDILTVSNGTNANVTFNVDDRALTAIALAKAADKAGNSYLANSLYSLPVENQAPYQIMLMIPFGVLVILLVRNIVGIQTLGTFTPVLIALAFRETELIFGIALFTVVVALGLSVRSYLEHLKLQMLSRLSVVLTFVVILIAVISIFSYKIGFARGLSISLFPMVILTMTIERLSITWEERGGYNALKIALGTLVASSLAYLLMEVRELQYFVFTFPGVLLVIVGFMLAMGRYRGYRLTELARFSALIEGDKK